MHGYLRKPARTRELYRQVVNNSVIPPVLILKAATYNLRVIPARTE
jgi:hypothetical protein